MMHHDEPKLTLLSNGEEMRVNSNAGSFFFDHHHCYYFKMYCIKLGEC